MGRAILRLVSGLVGLAFVVIGLNTALGGMATLGWQFPPLAAAVGGDGLDAARHDSNARFFAGCFIGIGAMVALAAISLRRFATVAALALLTVALGGLTRLSQAGYSAFADPALRLSVLAEIVGAPILAFWLSRFRTG